MSQNKPYFVCDLGLNHNGNLKRACDSVFQAKQCGFDAVKFQLYDAERLTEDPETRKLLKAGAFDPEWLPEIRLLCDDLKIDLAVTPFYPEAVRIITPYVDWIKIGSSEIDYEDLLSAAVGSDLPVIASAGFLINHELMRHPGFSALLYCVPKYPCSVDDIDMNWITNTKELSGAEIGYSDHSHDPSVIWAAIMAGASYIELHFDIDGCGLEYSQGHVWGAVECMDLLSNIKSAFKCFEPTSFKPDYSKMTNQNGVRK